MAKVKDTSPQKHDAGPIIIGPTLEERERLKRQCSCGAHTTGGQECEECRRKREGILQRKAAGSATSHSTASAPPIVGQVLNQPGRSLPSAARSRLEPAFGRDFSRVRVHSDTLAAQSARAVSARAYTVGQHIVFDHGQFDTDSPQGLHLLAHELAHTLQQGESTSLQRAGDLTVSPATDSLEREAEGAANRVLLGRSARLLGDARGGGPTLQRDTWGTIVNDRPQDMTSDDIGGGDRKISGKAESFIVGVYKSDRKDNSILSNHPPSSQLKNIDQSPNADPFLKVLAQEFVSSKERKVSAKLSEEEKTRLEKLTKEGLAGTSRSFVDESKIVEFKKVTKEPDILDFTILPHEVYDVTTLRKAPSKATKTIEVNYKDHLNKIYAEAKLGEPWIAGHTFKPKDKTKLRTDVNDSTGRAVLICYDRTDFVEFPGVIIYQAFLVGPTPAPSAAAFEKVTVIYTTGKTRQTVEFEVDPTQVVKGKKEFSLRGSTPANQAALAVLSPIVLVAYGRSAKNEEFVRAEYILDNHEFMKLRFLVNPKTRELRLPTNGEIHPARVPRLSEAKLALFLDDAGLHGEGPLQTSIPLLRKAPIQLQVSNERVAAVLKGSPEKTKPAIPGLSLTQAELGVEFVPDFSAKGSLGIAIGPPKKPLAEGLLKVSADENGLVAKGHIDAHIPGVEKAGGDITYQNRELSGGFEITTDQLRIPGVERVSLHAGFDKSGFNVTGKVDVKLPGGAKSSLGVRRKSGGRLEYFGSATFAVPGIHPVEATVTYDGEHFEGTGKTGFDIHGLHGDITAHYRDGRITGKGKAKIEKGRVNGEIGVTLHQNNTLTGEGKVSVQITDNLVGTVGVTLDEKKKVHVKGEIAFPKPIELFDRFPRAKEDQDKELFKVSQDIGIPGLSIGTFGVVAHIGARLGVSYYVGPGVLRDVKLEAGFDPLEETKNLAVHGHALLVIPAHAGVYILLEGGLGLSAVVASATGGLTVQGDLGLDALLRSQFDLDYREGRFALDAKPEIRAGINARLALGAYVDAHVGIGPLQAGARKDWVLKAYVWSGPTFGVVFPLHYASNEPFHAPSFDQIQIERPQIDAKGLLGGIFSSARSSVKEPGQ